MPTEERTTLFADVIVPLAVPNLFTYRIPNNWNDLAQQGQRVVIQFGKSKFYVGVIAKIHNKAPKGYEAKYIQDILDSKPIVNETHLAFWDWISTYYMCTPGDVMNAALPSGLRFSSETRIIKNESFSVEEVNEDYFTEREWKLISELEMKIELSMAEAADVLGIKNIQPIIQSLILKGAALVMEEMKGEFKPKKESYVRFTADITEDKLQGIFNQLEKKAVIQLELVMKYLQLSEWHTKKPVPVKKSVLLASSGSSLSSLNSLVKKNILEIYEAEVSRLKLSEEKILETNELSITQQEGLKQINKLFEEKNVVLLHGVTSSGKTELYMQLIDDAIQQNKKVLYMLPEIALTAQLVNRLKKRWGNKVGVYHSKFGDNERVEIWNGLINPSKIDYSVIVGTRSALFLPFSNLGLIIIDEEHDSSFKQQDPAPRYNARDAAIYLASLCNAKVILGSATPSVETYHNAASGKFGLVELLTRFGGMEMPEIAVCDLKEDTRKKLMKSMFTPYLLSSVEEALNNNEQVILFQNRRGFANFIECQVCANVPQCIRCDVSLTYHKKADLLRCHYCGYSITLPKICPACGSPLISTKGFGTEKIEEELATFFPKARIARMDLDSTRAKNAHTEIINSFEERKVDILVGTQMVTKGLDFDNVSIVGILNADAGLYFPDFRSTEKTFQMLAQVSGRAGRKNKRGKVVVQAYNVHHPVIARVMANDYTGMYFDQIEERKNFAYPPFTRLIEITLSHKHQEDLDAMSPILADALKKRFGADRVLGPEYPIVTRVQNFYQKKILLKIEREKYSL
ncbi:MAG TPA: primosomal protein N', partial [Bacteroidia bacterium]|nr:primosomal protein N' [Bacteroidia bacterium]